MVAKKIRLAGTDAPETSKKKNRPGRPFNQKSAKYLASLVLNNSVDVKSLAKNELKLNMSKFDSKNMLW
jgi:endonuclease YncB( thermonuclease family)